MDETREYFTLFLNLSYSTLFILGWSSSARFLLRSVISDGNLFLMKSVKFSIFPHTIKSVYILKVTDKDQVEAMVEVRRLRRSHANRIQHGACFIMAYALKPICCMLVEVVARDMARLRVKVSVGFAAAFAGRISRASNESRCTLESEYPRITGG